MKRTCKIFVEIIAALVAMIIIVVALVAWRIASVPMSATTLKPYVEKALMALVPQTRAHVENAVISWDNKHASLSFLAEGVVLESEKGDKVAAVPRAHLEVALFSLLRGRLVPSRLTVEAPRFWVTRSATGVFSFGLHDDVADRSQVAAEADSADLSAIGATFAGLARELTNKKLTHSIDMSGAAVTVHDEGSDRDWIIAMPRFSIQHEGRLLNGDALFEMEEAYKTRIEAKFAYDRGVDTHRIDLTFSNVNPALLSKYHPALASLAALNAPLGGEAAAEFAGDFALRKASGRLQIGKGGISVSSFWDGVRSIEGGGLDVAYDRATGLLKVANGYVDFGGPRLSIDAEGVPPAPQDAKTYDMAFTLKLGLAHLPMAQFGAVWPKAIIPNVRLWIMANMTMGNFPAGDVTLKGKLAWRDLENTLLETGSGKLAAADGHLTYMEGMPAVDGVNADATFNLERMDVTIRSGSVGAVRVQPFTLALLDFQKNIQRIEIPLKVIGPVQDVLKIMDSPPLGYAAALGVRPEDCEGRAEGTLDLKFPLLLDLRLDQVEVGAQARLTDFGARGLVPSLDVSQGDLGLVVSKEGYALKGPARLNTVPVQVVWQGNFDAEQRKLPRNTATITGDIEPPHWKLLGLDVLDGRVQGIGQAVVKFTQPNRVLSQLTGEVNFKGATTSVRELNWSKPSGVPATLFFAVDIPKDQNVQVRVLDFQSPGVKARGKLVLDGQTLAPLSIDYKPLALGRTNANVSYTQTLGAKRVEHYAIEGEALDISTLSTVQKAETKAEGVASAPGQQSKGGADAVALKEYSLKLGHLYSGETNVLHNVVGVLQRDGLGWTRMNFKARTDEKPREDNKLDVNLGFYDGRNVLNIVADDFGATMNALGYTETVNGGKLEVRGTSVPNDPRRLVGRVNVSGFGVRDLPVLARLMNAASPFGFADLISGETSFDHLRGGFAWTGHVIELQKIRLLGSSYGLNIDGKIDQETGEADLRGTLVPFSFLNSLLNTIPLLGDVLTGGEGQGVLAAAYTLKGKLTDPDISVNPASLLTPGFLRNLFFGED